MTLQEAIQGQYGIKLALGSEDGSRKVFKIDQLRNGWLLRMERCACFGSVIDGEIFVWSNGDLRFQRSEHRDSKQIRYEWLIWECARVMLANGERLSRVDSERLALAVKRLEEWL